MVFHFKIFDAFLDILFIFNSVVVTGFPGAASGKKKKKKTHLPMQKMQDVG